MHRLMLYICVVRCTDWCYVCVLFDVQTDAMYVCCVMYWLMLYVCTVWCTGWCYICVLCGVLVDAIYVYCVMYRLMLYMCAVRCTGWCYICVLCDVQVDAMYMCCVMYRLMLYTYTVLCAGDRGGVRRTWSNHSYLRRHHKLHVQVDGGEHQDFYGTCCFLITVHITRILDYRTRCLPLS